MGSLGLEWGEAEGSLEEFVDGNRNNLPQFLCVRDGFDDEEAKHSYASDEVYFIVTVEHQTRVVVRDRAGRVLSIPLEYPHYMRVVRKDGSYVSRVDRPKLVKQIIRRILNKVCTEQHVAFHENQAVNIQSGLGGSYDAKCDVLEIVDLHQQQYLVGHSVINGVIQPTVVAIPVYVPVTVSPATEISVDGPTPQEEFFSEVLKTSAEQRRQLDMDDLYNNEIMVVPEESANDFDEAKSREEVLLRIILRTRELRLSMESNDMAFHKAELAKRATVDRTSLPPPPPPPTEIKSPALKRATTVEGALSTPPESPPPPPPKEFADLESIPLPSKIPPNKRHFKLQSLIPSGGFPSLEKIKEQVSKRTSKLKKYNFPRLIGKHHADADGGVDRPLSPLSDYDDEPWSDDSFDGDFDDDFDCNENGAGMVDETSSTDAKANEIFTSQISPTSNGSADFKHELEKGLKFHNKANSGILDMKPTDPETVIDQVSVSKKTKHTNDLKEDGDSKLAPNTLPKPPPKRVALKPPGRSRPSLPSKPRGHFEKLSNLAHSDNELDSPPKSPSSPNDEQKKSVLTLVQKINAERPPQEKPKVGKKPGTHVAPTVVSAGRPSLPPKPKGKVTDEQNTSLAKPAQSQPDLASVKKSPKPPIKPVGRVEVGSINNSEGKSANVRLATVLKFPKPVKASRKDKDSSTKSCKDKSIKDIKPENHSPKPMPKPSPQTSSQETKMNFVFPRKGYEDAAYADIDAVSSTIDLNDSMTFENHYDEVYVSSQAFDRSSGDGAEMADTSYSMESKVSPKSKSAPKVKPVSPPPVGNRKPLKLPDESIADLYAKPMLLKKKSLASNKQPASPAIKSSVMNKDSCNAKKYSNLSEVPLTLSELSVPDVLECLSLLKMSKHVDDFKDNEIDGSLMHDLDETVLQNEFSFSLFDAKKLVKFVGGWRPKLK